MGQQQPIKLDRILNQAEDPETGLALLSKRPHPNQQTPEQNLECYFWQDQFTHWRDFRAGEVLAVWRAAASCALSKRPPPAWLCRAIEELCRQCMSDDEKHAYSELAKHRLRWEAVECVRGRYTGHPRNYQRKVQGDAVWAEAAKLVADADTNVDARADVETVRKSHALIWRAGGHNVTLQSSRREAGKRYQHRKKIRADS